MNSEDAGWLKTSESYQARLLRAGDLPDRLTLLSDSPMFSFWSDIKSELARASEEIRMLRQRVKELENDTNHDR